MLKFRFQEATCHAALGDSELALRVREELLRDERRIYGPDDLRVAELREQIGLLLHGIGRSSEAVQVLDELVADLEDRHGPDHADVERIRESIRRMKHG